MAKAKETAENNKAEIEKEAEEKWIADEKSRAEVMEKLCKDYEENGNKWVDAIVNRILS